MPEAGSWDWWGGLGQAITGQGDGGADAKKKRERLLRQYVEYNRLQAWTELNNLQLQHPDLFKKIKAGKFDSYPGVAQARGVGLRPGTGVAIATRPGDLPFRTPAGAIPNVGMVRKIATGALRVGGPASWVLFAATLTPPGWIEAGKTALGRYGAVMARGQARGSGPAAGGIPRRGPAAAPAPVPKRAAGIIQPRPAGSNIAIAKLPEIAPIVVTAKKKPVPSYVKLPPVKPKWWEVLLANVQKLPLAALMPKQNTAPRSRVTVDVGPFAYPPATEQPKTDPIVDPLTPFGPSSATCECPKKAKPKRKPQARNVCYSGTFIERQIGINKTRMRKTPCRPFRKKPSSRQAR